MSKLPEGAPLPEGWGEDRRAEAEELWRAYRSATLESPWGRDKFRKTFTGSPEILDWLDLARSWDSLEFETTRQMKLKLTDREADRRIKELDAANRPPVVWRNGTWLTAQQFDPMRWAVPGLFPEGMTFECDHLNWPRFGLLPSRIPAPPGW
jgi:hypothetical protein